MSAAPLRRFSHPEIPAKAAKAWPDGFHTELVMPFQGATRDNNIRAGTGVDKLGRSQTLASVDRAKMNVRGGSIAIGNSFAAIGAQLASALAKLLAQWDSGGG